MRIGIYDPYLDTMSGGEKYILTAAECLSKAHEVSIFWNKDEEEQIKELAERRFGFDLSQYDFSPNIFTNDVSLVERLVESRKYDAILVLSDGSIPVISCPLLLHFQSPLPWVKGTSLKSKIKMSLVHEVICNSQFTKSHIDKTFGINSHVLYPPVEIIPDNKSTKENIILNVGRFGIQQSGSSFKKQDVLADVFVRMIQGGLKDWQLVFVMNVAEKDNSLADEFRKKYKEYPITFHINQPNKVVWEMYHKSKIYWHAAGYAEDTKKNPDRAEHFGMSTVEAMGSGAVPIVFGAGGQIEIVNSDEVGAIWYTQEELIAKTLELITNQSKREHMSSESKKRAENFSKDTFCEKLLSLLP